VRGAAQRNPYLPEYDVNLIDFTYSSSHEDLMMKKEDLEEEGIQGMMSEI